MNAVNPDIAVIGLGYVGLPLAVELARHYRVTGFDVDSRRIRELAAGIDVTREVEQAELDAADLHYSDDPAAIADCNIYIVTVPTPIDRHKRPDLEPLMHASETVGRLLGEGDIVIYESTVFPGATEEVCAPILERESGLRYISESLPPTSLPRGEHPEGHEGWGEGGSSKPGFYLGYSPERINPGDREHRVASIRKVTAGSTPAIAEYVDALYARAITAGTHRAPSIRVAEAAKVIENTQRDVNIALINELAVLFNRLGLDTQAVLEAAGTKWNFLPFRPGLVGGHCIGVDPYYLTHKAQEVGHHPEMILAGRRINDRMGEFVAGEVIKLMTRKRIPVVDADILVMGLTFKENCPDLRNTHVIDVIREFEAYHARVDVFDPWVDPQEAREEYAIEPLTRPQRGRYDAIILAVGHDQFRAMSAADLRALGREDHVLYDLKWLLAPEASDGRL